MSDNLLFVYLFLIMFGFGFRQIKKQMSRGNLNTNNNLNLSRDGLKNIVFDANKLQIGVEYNYRTTDLNSPRGNDEKLNDYINHVNIVEKRNSYNLIYNDLVSNKKLGFQNRILGIQKHSLYLGAKSRALSIAGIPDPEIAEIVLKITLSIASLIPVLRPIALIGSISLKREAEKDAKRNAELQNKILTDTKLLNLELANLKASINSIPELIENGSGIDTSKGGNLNDILTITERNPLKMIEDVFDSLAIKTGIDRLGRAANISNTQLIGGALLGAIIIYKIKNRNAKKRKK